MKPFPSARRGLCVMCGAPIQPGLDHASVFCGSKICEARHRAIPAAHRCQVCTRPLSVAEWASGVCDDLACRHDQFVTRRLAQETEAQRTILAAGRRRRARSAAQRGIQPSEHDTYRLAILPYNADRVSKLPAARRAAFEAHLRANLAKARERLAAGERYQAPASTTRADSSGDSAAPARSATHLAAEQALLGAACAACRGFCCTSGQDHAFNRSETMMRYLGEYPDHDDETIVSLYMGYLAERTMTHGCVYQGATGCTMPRTLRSDICNSFHCGGLTMLRNHYEPGDPLRAFVLRHKGTHVLGGTFLDTGPADQPATSAVTAAQADA